MKGGLIALIGIMAAAAACVADYRPGYYDPMEGKTKAELKAAAKECVAEHTTLRYSDLPNYWISTDVYPDLTDGLRRWWEMYSDNVYLIEAGMTGKQSFSAHSMEREHAVPKSWWKKDGNVEYTPAYSDMWNLYPSDGDTNGAKSNYPFGVTAPSARFDNGVSKVGVPADGYGGLAPRVFEPADCYKGDFARTLFYMATVYDDLPWCVEYMLREEPYPTLTDWSVTMLLDWSRKDPVSPKETERNDAVELCQGNRNPYVDFPELAEYVWGKRTDRVFRIAEQGQPGGVGEIVDDTPMAAGPMRIFRLDGVMVHESAAAYGELPDLPAGIYVVTVGGTPARKLVIR